MLNQLRQGAQGWVSKVLMILLVLSFAVWGIGGFEGYGAGTVATVGDAEVSTDEFARLYDEAQRQAQQNGEQASPEQVLAQLLHSAALDDEAADYNLGVSDDRVAEEIATNAAFQTDGTFDPDRFAGLLQNARITRDDFVRTVRRDLVRGQIADTLGAGFDVPQPLVEAIYRLQNEERTVSFISVDASVIEAPGTPDEAALATWFEENKGDFRAPEFRKLGLIVLDASAIADPADVSEEEVAAEYERRKDNFTQPERRRVEQIRYESADTALAALEAAEGGKDFAALAEERGVTPADIDLGLKTKAEIIDPAVAEAAFAAEEGKPVAVTDGALEPSLIRVTEIEPGSVRPLEEVAERLRSDLATRVARDSIQELYDQVEDERAGGATLEEVAAKLSLDFRVVDGISANGESPEGELITDIPNEPQVLTEAFQSDVGVENSPIRTDSDGWLFFEVLDVTPERDRTLDELQKEATEAWTTEETETRIAAKADELLERLQAGETLTALATEIGKSVETAEGLTRNENIASLTQNAVSQAFAGPQGHLVNADGAGANRILLRVDKVTAPAFFPDAAGVAEIRERLSEDMRSNLLASYNRQLLQMRETSVNNAVMQQLTGQMQTQ